MINKISCTNNWHIRSKKKAVFAFHNDYFLNWYYNEVDVLHEQSKKNDQHFIEKNKSKLVYWISQQDHQSVGQGLAKKEKKIGKMLEKR